MPNFGLHPKMPVQYIPLEMIPAATTRSCPQQVQMQNPNPAQIILGPWRTVPTPQCNVAAEHITPPIVPVLQTPAVSVPQTPLYPSSFPMGINDANILECAKQMYLSLGWSKSVEEILSSLQSRDLTLRSKQTAVFLKLFDILIHYSKIEKFSLTFKEKVSRYFDILAGQFPVLKLNDYFINLGPNPSVPQNADPVLAKKIQESKFALTLAQSGVDHIVRTNMPQSPLPPDNIDSIKKVDSIKFEELQKYLQDFPANQTIALIISHKTKHLSLLLAQSKHGQMNFVVIESLTGMYVPSPSYGQLIGSIPLQEVIDCIAKTFTRQRVSKISYFTLKRQNDITLCPIFVLSDLAWCLSDNMFYYVDYVERNYPSKILKTEIPADTMVTIQAIPTHPGLLLTTQSAQFFAPLSGLPSSSSAAQDARASRMNTEQFDPDFTFRILKREFFESEIRASLLEVSPQKFMNLKAEMIFLKYARKILGDLLTPYLLS